MALPTGWGRRTKFTIQSSQVDTNMTNMRVVLDENVLPPEWLDSADSNHALSGGGDIRFSSDVDGNTQLACRIIKFVLDGEAEIAVNVPAPSASVDTVFYGWHKKAGETQPIRTDPYGSDNVPEPDTAMLHTLAEDPTVAPLNGAIDETSNQNDGSTTGSACSVATGKIGQAWQFSAAQKIDVSHDASLSPDYITLMAWVYLDDSRNEMIIQKGDGTATGNQYWWIVNSSRKLQYEIRGVSGTSAISGTGIIPLSTWTHIALKYGGANVKLYINGALDRAIPAAIGAIKQGNNANLDIGDAATGVWFFNGRIDQVEIHGIGRSDDWISTYYNSQNSPLSFVVASAPETPSSDSTPPTITAQNPANGDTGVAIDASIYFELDDDSSGVDSSTITVTVEGVNAILNGVFQSGFSGTITADGTGLGYDVTINHTADWSLGQVINVTVDADDANTNSMTQYVYSFTCIDDITPPTTIAHNPADADAGVAIDTNIYFEIDDAGTGVDVNTLTVTIEGSNAILNGVQQPGFVAAMTPDGVGGFDVTINPDVDFANEQIVNVTIDADDLASIPNSMVQDAYSFTCIALSADGAGRESLEPNTFARTGKSFLSPNIMIN